jgi:hypothetical protein
VTYARNWWLVLMRAEGMNGNSYKSFAFRKLRHQFLERGKTVVLIDLTDPSSIIILTTNRIVSFLTMPCLICLPIQILASLAAGSIVFSLIPIFHAIQSQF